MKTFYSFIFFLLVSGSAFSQTYYIYSATKSGYWNDPTVWSISVRMDGVQKTKVVIPAAFTVSVDNAVNSFGMGDVEINLYGSLSLQPSTNIILSAVSSIELFGSGSIIGSNNTQKITLGAVTKYDGSLDHTKTGASIANSTTGVSPNGFYAASVLPVKFTSFTVLKVNNSIVLKWATATEVSNDYFDIERSYNGSDWVSISTLKGTGSAAANAYYSYTDNTANSTTIFYRLKQVDADGAVVYSIVKTVRAGNTAVAKIYGAGNTLTVELNSEIKNPVIVTIMNTNGQVMEKKQFSAGYKISLDLNYKSVIVLVNVSDNDKLNQTAKLFL